MNVSGIHDKPRLGRKPPETGRYVLLVDRQAKRSFELRDAAESEAQQIRSRFPHLRVTVEDNGPVPKRA
jgi:hypothetical protein